MHKYRKEHTENDHLYVYIWVKRGKAVAAQPDLAPSTNFGDKRILKIIWDALGLDIDASAVASPGIKAESLGLESIQLPPRTRYQAALTWVEDTEEGRKWANGEPAQLIIVKIDAVTVDNGVRQ